MNSASTLNTYSTSMGDLLSLVTTTFPLTFAVREALGTMLGLATAPSLSIDTSALKHQLLLKKTQYCPCNKEIPVLSASLLIAIITRCTHKSKSSYTCMYVYVCWYYEICEFKKPCGAQGNWTSGHKTSCI